MPLNELVYYLVSLAAGGWLFLRILLSLLPISQKRDTPGLREGLLQAQGTYPPHRIGTTKDPWLHYNERWTKVQHFIQARYSDGKSRSDQRDGVPFFKTFQPDFIYDAIPWPVPSTNFSDVNENNVRAFYRHSPLHPGALIPQNRRSTQATKLRALYVQLLVYQELERWLPFIVHKGRLTRASERDRDAVRKLYVVLEMLAEVCRDSEERILWMLGRSRLGS